MKDCCRVERYVSVWFYYNENNQKHRLTGPAVVFFNADKEYYINNIRYMCFYKDDNELYIIPEILKLNSKYEKYIKQNIKDLIEEYNTKIEFDDNFYTQKRKLNKNYLKKFPDWLKDWIML